MKNDEDNISCVFGPLLFAAIGYIGWAGWPTSLWLGVVILGILVADFFINNLDEFVANILSGIRPFAVAVSIGLGLVVIAQITLVVCKFIDALTVLRWENQLSLFSERFEFFFEKIDLTVFICLLFAMLAAAWIFPKFAAVSHFGKARTIATQFGVALTVVSSFSFFGTASIRAMETSDRALLQQDIADTFERVAKIRSEVLAATVVEVKLDTLDKSEKAAIQAFFETADNYQIQPAEISKATYRIAESILKVSASVEGTDSRGQYEPKSGAAALQEPSPETDYDKRAGLHELKSTLIDQEREFKRLSETRLAALDFLVELVGELVPGANREIIGRFMRSLLESVATQVVDGVLPKHVDNTPAVREWAMSRFIGAGASGSWTVAAAWKWLTRRIANERSVGLVRGPRYDPSERHREKIGIGLPNGLGRRTGVGIRR